MKGYRLPSLLAACLLAALGPVPLAPRGRGGDASPPEQDAVRLVRELGSKSFEVREAATRRLLEYEAPPPALRAAVKSGDPEVARRASRIIDEITHREENVAFAKLIDLARRGEVDRFIELLARRPKWHDEDACWQAVADLNGKLLDPAREKHRRPEVSGTDGKPLDGKIICDFRRYYPRTIRPKMVVARRADLTGAGPFVVVRAEHITAGSGTSGLLVSSRGTRARSAHRAIILAGGPVEVGVMSGHILVCAGDVKCINVVECLLIARGDVRISGFAADCCIISAGSVQFLPNTWDGKVNRRREVEIIEHEPNPLGFVKWFDPVRVGVTVEAAPGGVRVRAAGKSFAAAGLRAGDLLTALDGEAVKSPDEFRLLLRAKLADGGRMALAVRRAGRDLKIPVRCND